MNDEQLLKLAAKAADLNVKAVFVDADDNLKALVIGDKFTKERVNWNPLQDDGDALRLAVKLGLTPIIDIEHFDETEIDGTGITESHGDDPVAATRRAIVRAAAKIGEKML